MPDSSLATVNASHTDEQSPLLGNGKQTPDHGTIERGADDVEEDESGEDDVPIAAELSTAKLVLVLSSIWIGSFLAALGLYSRTCSLPCGRVSDNLYQTLPLLPHYRHPYPHHSILYLYFLGLHPPTSLPMQPSSLSVAV